MVMSLIIGTGNHLMDKRMKNLIVILLLSCSILSAQYNPYNSYPDKHEWKYKEAVKTIAVYSSSIILSAVADGLNDGVIGDKSYKPLGHALNATSVGILLVSPFILDYNRKNMGWYFASYLTLRIGIFDLSYNKTRGLPLGYVGNSSIYDKFWQSLKSPESWIVAKDAFFFTIGIMIPINEL